MQQQQEHRCVVQQQAVLTVAGRAHVASPGIVTTTVSHEGGTSWSMGSLPTVDRIPGGRPCQLCRRGRS